MTRKEGAVVMPDEGLYRIPRKEKNAKGIRSGVQIWASIALVTIGLILALF